MLEALCLLASGTDPNHINSVTFHLKASWQSLQRGKKAKILLFNVGDGLAMGADHVVMKTVLHFNSKGTMMHADFSEHALLNEEMNIFIDSRKRYHRNALFYASINFFRIGMAGHGPHYFVENLPLVGGGEPMIRAQFTKGRSFDAGIGLHK